MLEKGGRKETITLPTPGDTAAAGAPPGAPVTPVTPGAPVPMPENGRRPTRR
jgi:hypothetical protein